MGHRPKLWIMQSCKSVLCILYL